MKHLVIPTVNIFIINGSDLLLGRRINTGWMDESLCPFGGHIEKDETPLLAIIREVKEELGVKVKPEDIEFGCVAARKTSAGETVAYEFIIRDKNYSFTNAEPEKCSELAWVDLDNLPNDIIDQFKEIIAQKPYIEVGY